MPLATAESPKGSGSGDTAMIAALPNKELRAHGGGNGTIASRILVSCVRNATDTVAKDYDAKEIIESIRADKHWKLLRYIEDLRRKFNEVITETGERKAAKTAVAGAKKGLPGVLWSGRFAKRSRAGLLEHSGLLCADLDELGDKLSEVRGQLLKSPYVWALFTSPSGDGLKCVFRVRASAAEHQASFLAVKQHVRELGGAQVDESCSDVSRLCFLSHDPGAYLNEGATELPLLPSVENSEQGRKEIALSPEQSARQGIAVALLGDIEWDTESKGLCSCPGGHLHTTGDGERDCRVCLDGAPTISCFHNHCSKIVKAKNHELRSLVGKAERRKADQGKASSLPEPIDALELLSSDLTRPPELVRGILHKGSKMVIGGGSKSFKTWTLVDLAVSVATGTKWWGFETTKGRVVYMNFEIQDAFFKERLQAVCVAKECQLENGQLSYWGLRGRATDLNEMLPQIIAKLKDEGCSLIVFDPIYKGLGNRDENKAGDIASLLNELEKLAVETGAAVAFGHHFSKGNQAGKESIDRIGGSGVFARDPDTILTMTRHEQDDAFVIDPILRNFLPIDPFVVRRAHPLMVRDEGLDPKALKRAGASQEKYSDTDILASLTSGGKTTTEWEKDLWTRLAMSVSCFHVRRRALEHRGAIRKEGKKWVITGKDSPTTKGGSRLVQWCITPNCTFAHYTTMGFSHCSSSGVGVERIPRSAGALVRLR